MNRSSFLLASSSVAVLGGGAVAAAGVPGGTQFIEHARDFDRAAFDALVGRPADIRQLFEAVSFHDGLFNNVKNALNGLQYGFGFPAARIAFALCLHGPSSAYNYSDDVWSKYKIGEAFKLKDAKGNPIRSNVFLQPSKATQADEATDIPALQKRGVIFLTCHTAVEEQARNLIKGGFAPAGMTPTQVADDILTHLIPGTHVVPSMVAAVGVLQHQYHYAYTTIDFV